MSQTLAIFSNSKLPNEIAVACAGFHDASGAYKTNYIGSRIIHQVFTKLQERGYIKSGTSPMPQNLRPLGEDFKQIFSSLQGLISYAEEYDLDNDDGFAELANFAEGGQQFLTLQQLQAVTKKVMALTHRLFYGDDIYANERSCIGPAEIIHIPIVDGDRILAYRDGLESIEADWLHRNLDAGKYRRMEVPVGFANILAFHLASAAYAGDYQQLRQSPASISLATQESSFQERYVKSRESSKSLAAAAQLLEWLVFASDDGLALRSFYDPRIGSMDVIPVGYIAGVLNALVAGRRNSVTEEERNIICIPGHRHRYDDDLQKQLAKCIGERFEMIRRSSGDDFLSELAQGMVKSAAKGLGEDQSREILEKFIDFLRENFFGIMFGMVDMSDSEHSPDEIRQAGKFSELLGQYNERIEELRRDCTESFMREYSSRHADDVTAVFQALYVGSKREGLVHDIGDAAAVMQMLRGQGNVRTTT